MCKIATWNVNSVRVRLPQILDWMASSQTDVLALQETKIVDEQFPKAVFTDAGYHVSFWGQKTYNGVAFISRQPLSDVTYGLTKWPENEVQQCRVMTALWGDVRIVNVYVPNGASPDTEQYSYKLNWLAQLKKDLQHRMLRESKMVVLGDFNIAPHDRDVHDPAAWEGSVLVSPAERDALGDILSLGFIDIFRALYPDVVQYTWWDYRAARFRRDHGLRIDLILGTKAFYQTCRQSGVDIEPRKHERPSDHTPVWVICDKA